jgi:hypothetical protein
VGSKQKAPVPNSGSTPAGAMAVILIAKPYFYLAHCVIRQYCNRGFFWYAYHLQMDDS